MKVHLVASNGSEVQKSIATHTVPWKYCILKYNIFDWNTIVKKAKDAILDPPPVGFHSKYILYLSSF